MKGIALILTTVIIALAMAAVFGLGDIFIAETLASQNIDRSTVAFYLADAGIEGELYADRISNPRTSLPGTDAGADDCSANGNGVTDGSENGDTCLDQLSNGGYYRYIIKFTVGTPRQVASTGNYLGVKRTIEIDY